MRNIFEAFLEVIGDYCRAECPSPFSVTVRYKRYFGIVSIYFDTSGVIAEGRDPKVPRDAIMFGRTSVEVHQNKEEQSAVAVDR